MGYSDILQRWSNNNTTRRIDYKCRNSAKKSNCFRRSWNASAHRKIGTNATFRDGRNQPRVITSWSEHPERSRSAESVSRYGREIVLEPDNVLYIARVIIHQACHSDGSTVSIGFVEDQHELRETSYADIHSGCAKQRRHHSIG